MKQADNIHVGCGTGTLARQLTERGYAVECVTPSPFLAACARQSLGGSSPVYESRFEELQTEKRYDLILFSESFQYVDLEPALLSAHRLLKSGGHLLIFDFFRIEADDPSPMGGGHDLTLFHERIARLPFIAQVDQDATAETAPTLALAEDFVNRVVRPINDLVSVYLQRFHPLLFRAGRWVLGKRIRRLSEKYLSGKRTAESFRLHKSYRLFVYQKASECLTTANVG